jgi:hypothetical protein
VQLLEASDEQSRYGVYLNHGPGDRTYLTLAADRSSLLCDREGDALKTGWRSSLQPAVGTDFSSDAYHRLLVRVRGGKVEVQMDGARVTSGIEGPPGTSSVGLLTWGTSAAFDGVSVTALAR